MCVCVCVCVCVRMQIRELRDMYSSGKTGVEYEISKVCTYKVGYSVNHEVRRVEYPISTVISENGLIFRLIKQLVLYFAFKSQ